MLVVQLALRDVISDAVLDENGNAEERGTCPNTHFMVPALSWWAYVRWSSASWRPLFPIGWRRLPLLPSMCLLLLLRMAIRWVWGAGGADDVEAAFTLGPGRSA